ncbi:hypothetical protein BpHYR1_022937 [Brachionus plicatilis]|uniref:Uncharacterized protein n=1 Tax=Brachionus plicatilis TaxID=10195 RepID=A0A3M7PYK4_BRAPC|nr:hypothetical protein BpHYR1_022937 [Brachionus plicatilis]
MKNFLNKIGHMDVLKEESRDEIFLTRKFDEFHVVLNIFVWKNLEKFYLIIQILIILAFNIEEISDNICD